MGNIIPTDDSVVVRVHDIEQTHRMCASSPLASSAEASIAQVKSVERERKPKS